MIGKRGNEKLTPAQVKQIMARLDCGNTAMAREYGVCARTIANIRRGRSWKSITEVRRENG